MKECKGWLMPSSPSEASGADGDELSVFGLEMSRWSFFAEFGMGGDNCSRGVSGRSPGFYPPLRVSTLDH